MTVHHYFVFRVTDPTEVDERCPTGAVTVTGDEPVTVMRDAFLKARDRYPTKPYQSLVLHEVSTTIDRRHVELVEADWERAFAKFQELMTVS